MTFAFPICISIFFVRGILLHTIKETFESLFSQFTFFYSFFHKFPPTPKKGLQSFCPCRVERPLQSSPFKDKHYLTFLIFLPKIIPFFSSFLPTSSDFLITKIHLFFCRFFFFHFFHIFHIFPPFFLFSPHTLHTPHTPCHLIRLPPQLLRNLLYNNVSNLCVIGSAS